MAVERKQSQRHRKPKPSKPPKDERTKFDKWLESHIPSGESIEMKFKVSPVQGMDDPIFYDVHVLTVDRYQLFLDFGDEHGQWWVAKEQIISCN